MDQLRFRNLMARVPAPVTVVTTVCDGDPKGATVSSFASLSLEPPLITIALINGTALLESIRASKIFAVNLLGHRQSEIALQFASRTPDRFAGVSWNMDAGLPRLHGAASYLKCALEAEIEGGDHILIFGRVEDCSITDEPPLVYTARKFGTHSKLVSDREKPIDQLLSIYCE